jgi:Kef-type K+ transport system membrane component KefB
MKQVLIFSCLLVAGLAASQLLPAVAPEAFGTFGPLRQWLTMICLGFLMIHVGYEFEIDKRNLRQYAVDYGVAATAAGFPWLFCSAYFVWVMGSAGWTEALLAGRFAAPTSAGLLFSMLAAAGLSVTWVFRKARVLAIFDDLDTVLLMIPLKMMIVGFKWQLVAIVFVLGGLLWLAWRYLHAVRWPISWPWVLGYAVGITAVSEGVYAASKVIDDVVPIHLEVLLPAFVLGCMLARPAGSDPHADDAREGHQEGPEDAVEQRVATLVSGLFMVLVGLSMPRIAGTDGASAIPWGTLAWHTLALTVLANLGKMFPLFCYRAEAGWGERLGLCIGMWPRGEVGAGVLVVSLTYAIAPPIVAAAALSLALNLVLTGLFIAAVKALVRR